MKQNCGNLIAKSSEKNEDLACLEEASPTQAKLFRKRGISLAGLGDLQLLPDLLEVNASDQQQFKLKIITSAASEETLEDQRQTTREEKQAKYVLQVK